MKIINLAKTLLRKNSWFVGSFQALLILISLVIAWLLRFDFTLPDRRLLLATAPILILIRLLAVARFGLLHGWWRYAGLSDALDVVKAVVTSTVIFVIVVRYGLGMTNFPRSVYVLEPLITTILLGGVRMFSRILAESVRQDLGSSRKVLLIGAGIGGQTVVREIRRPGSEYTPLGYVDDDHSKLRLRIEGVPVIGIVKDLPELVKSYPVDEVLIAVPSATSQQMQHFVRACQKASVKFRTVPALRDVIAQRVSISDFRQVDVNDLLGREPVRIDLESVRMAIMGRVIVVTGAAGSIGSELCRQILEYRPRVLICIDHNETGLFYLQHELAHLKSKAILRFYVADVGDQRRMEAIFCTDHPDTIFHAAAYKHVPMMETNVQEAVQNNVFALLRLLEAASEKGCDTFILISSDKAVCPSSVMGATKRICELIINHRPTETMRCLSVRFGNVLGSNGSVVPVLQEQLRKGQPLTITHPDMKRFFMTIREAVSLVLQASLVGEHGETLVLDMGEPLSILEVAQTLIRLSGKSVQDVPIVFTGVRPGERLTERLFYDDEEVCPTSFPKIKRVRCATRDWTALSRRIEELEEILFLIGAESVRAKIREMVPEYSDEVQLSAVG